MNSKGSGMSSIPSENSLKRRRGSKSGKKVCLQKGKR